jgi:hypothetical protein
VAVAYLLPLCVSLVLLMAKLTDSNEVTLHMVHSHS